MNNTRIGVIGTGAIAQVHLEAWQRLPVDLVGYFDLDRVAAARAAATYGGRVFDSLDDLLQAVDMVDICTPGTAHKEPVLAAAAAGKAIICEKPLARRLADCEEMVAACDDAGVPLYPAHVVRFFPEYARVKETLESGAIGKAGVLRSVRTGSFPRPGSAYSSAYYGDFARSGGVILDVGIHDLDFMRWCCGDVARVFARGTTLVEAPRNDHALITLRFKNGALGHVQCSWALPTGIFRTRIEAAGDGGLVEWDSLDHPSMLLYLRNAEDTGHDRSGRNPLAPEVSPYYAELAHFLRAYESGGEARVTGADGTAAVRLSLAAIESMRTGRPVDPALVKDDIV